MMAVSGIGSLSLLSVPRVGLSDYVARLLRQSQLPIRIVARELDLITRHQNTSAWPPLPEMRLQSSGAPQADAPQDCRMTRRGLITMRRGLSFSASPSIRSRSNSAAFTPISSAGCATVVSGTAA